FAFYVSCSSAPRHLHSFPTRRSSDLTIPTPSTRPVSGSARIFVSPSLRPSVRARPEAAHSRLAIFTVRPTRAASDSVSPHQATRSEEHTSELQSPYDLVCRLLLEKKK